MKRNGVHRTRTLVAHPIKNRPPHQRRGRAAAARRRAPHRGARLDGWLVFAADLHPAIAANPYIAFPLVVQGEGTLEVRWAGDRGFAHSAGDAAEECWPRQRRCCGAASLRRSTLLPSPSAPGRSPPAPSLAALRRDGLQRQRAASPLGLRHADPAAAGDTSDGAANPRLAAGSRTAAAASPPPASAAIHGGLDAGRRRGARYPAYEDEQSQRPLKQLGQRITDCRRRAAKAALLPRRRPASAAARRPSEARLTATSETRLAPEGDALLALETFSRCSRAACRSRRR
ncbi:MAG: thiosulfate oxidation carrier complex protein SoxZ [Rubrivivax sp.]